jgi:hypothetical protein
METPIDAETRAALDHWLEHRKRLNPGALTPFFCTHAAGQAGNKMYEGYLNVMLRRAAKKAGIQKRVSPLVLRATFIEEREAARASALGSTAVAYIDDYRFRESYPRTYERWLLAVALFEDDPEKHADRIGDECRKSLAEYADELAETFEVEVPDRAGTYAKVQVVLNARATGSAAGDIASALMRYWKATSGATQSLAHAGARRADQRPLQGEDARRAVFNTLFVMHEIDHSLRVS